MEKSVLKGHGAMFGAVAMWGFMSPISKMVMGSEVTPLLLTDCRIIGAAILFWIFSLFTKHEHVERRDLFTMFLASLVGIIFNQGLFIFGLGLTSPIDATVITTGLPILVMIISTIFLHDSITIKKVIGVILGASGALILIIGSTSATRGESNIWGDLCCLTAQICFASYLVFFRGIITHYSSVTLMKWMFTFASICILPLSFNKIVSTEWISLGGEVLGGISFVVIGATFLSYLLIPIGQRYLRPTLIGMYNYLQPIIATIIAIYLGQDSFSLLKGIAIILVFVGVYAVSTSSKGLPANKEFPNNKESSADKERVATPESCDPNT